MRRELGTPTRGVATTCIVVPAYNEAERFDVESLEEYLRSGTAVRFILVNDGSTDDTLRLLRRVEDNWPARIQVLDLPENLGKAEAVRNGVNLAFQDESLEAVGYWDADWATPLCDIERFVECLARRSDIDIAIGSRVALLGRTIDRKVHRHYLGRIAATCSSLVLGVKVYDTQCGAKLLRVGPATQAILRDRFHSGWVFDVELIARYLQETAGKAGIYELPLDYWRDVGESKVRPTDVIRSFGQIAQIYRNYRLPTRFQAAFDFATAPLSRYVVVGAMGTAAHYLTLLVGVETVGMQPAHASGAGGAVGALVNYGLNYHFTFSSTRPHRQTLPKFSAVALLGIIANVACVRFGVSSLGLHYLLAQTMATFGVLVLGFILNRAWTFGQREPQGAATAPPAAVSELESPAAESHQHLLRDAPLVGDGS